MGDAPTGGNQLEFAAIGGQHVARGRGGVEEEADQPQNVGRDIDIIPTYAQGVFESLMQKTTPPQLAYSAISFIARSTMSSGVKPSSFWRVR